MKTHYEEERRKNLYEYITTTHMICVLILIGILIINNKQTDSIYPVINTRSFFLISLFGFGLVVIYNARKLLPGVKALSLWFDIIYIMSLLLLVLLALFISSGSVLYVETILILPVLISASIMGKVPGLIMATVCTINIIIYQFINDMANSIIGSIELSLILISLMYVVGWFIGGLTDVEKEHRQNLTQMAITDALTGLYNHRFFQEELKEYTSEATKENPLSLIMIDIDYFKHYNDNCGHLEGDNVLKTLAVLFKETTARPGFAARYGGEEFVLVLPGCGSQAAVNIAEGIRSKVENLKFPGDEYQPGGNITISCGIATYPTHATSGRELIKHADQALYRAKYLNKNKVELYFSVFDELDLEENEKKLLDSIRTLVLVINAKDRYTYGHSERVTEYSIRLAEKVGLDQEDIRLLKYAAFLHDIGKIEIDRSILNKSDILNEEEWLILQQHPGWGSDIVKSVTQLQAAAAIILHHHENYDGSGYPGQLAGEDIPLLSRIIRITDSYDAMTSNRPYKKDMQPEEALQEIKRCKGTAYDPQLAEHFTKMMDSSESGQRKATFV